MQFKMTKVVFEMVHNEDLSQLKEEREKIITSTALMNLDPFH